MIYIAHRGNINGPNPDKENHPDYVTTALKNGYHVEVDAWLIDNQVYLGHDAPTYEATDYFQYQGTWYDYNGHFRDSPSLWVHCKNFEALSGDAWYFHGNYFTHDKDDFTLTSQGYIWTYPRLLPLSCRSIAVMPERVLGWDLSKAYGICSDYVEEYKKDINFKLNL
jgi:hypothetical protein